MTPELHRGDIWWADIPGDKVRPVLVITRERFVTRLDPVLVAPVTSRVRDIPTEVPLGTDEGLPRASAANFDNIFTLRRARFRERIGRLSAGRLSDVCEAHRFAAGC